MIPLQVIWSFLTSRIGLAACTFALGYGLCWWHGVDDAKLRDARARAEALQADLDAAKLASKYDEVLTQALTQRQTHDRELIDAYASELAKAQDTPAEPAVEPPSAVDPEPPLPTRIPALPRHPDPCRLDGRDLRMLDPIGR